jgi:DNA polymerase-4
VLRGRAARSIGSDRTLKEDVSDPQAIKLHLRRAAERIARRVRAKSYVAGGIRVRLKTSRFELLSRQQLLPKPADTAAAFYNTACKLLAQFDHPGPFRLVGMAAFDLDWRDQPLQMDLFESTGPRQLETTIDQLIARFGSDTVVRAADLLQPGTVSSNGVNLDFLDVRDGERVARPGR